MRKLSFVIVIALLLSLFSLPVAAEEITGTVDGGFTWRLSGDGVLTISGTGAMKFNTEEGQLGQPWKDYQQYIVEVVIEEGITEMDLRAFQHCVNIEKVSLPSTLTVISSQMFDYCAKLTALTIPENVTTIDTMAFRGCTGLKELVVPASVSLIKSDAFADCSFEKLVVNGSPWIVMATLPAKNVYFHGDAPNFDSATFSGQTVTAYYPGDNPSWTADKLQNYGGNVTWIKETSGPSGTVNGGFTWRLSEDGVLTISGTGAMMFNTEGQVGQPWKDYQQYIVEVVIEEGITEMDLRAFQNCVNIEKVSLPSTLTIISSQMFQNCEKLTQITIPENVTKLDAWAFQFCDLREITIPASVTHVLDAFVGCRNLKKVVIMGSPLLWQSFCTSATEIWFYGDAPQFMVDTFLGNTATVYYPAGNPTWTADKLQNYGGNVTWVPMCYNGHSFGDWVQVKAPSVEEFGTLRRECAACHTTEEQDIPKLTAPPATEPKPTEPAPTQPVPTEPVSTEPVPTVPAPTEPVASQPTEPKPTQGTTPPTQAPTQEAPAPTQPVTVTPAPENNDLWMIYAGVALVVISGGALAVWIYVIKRRK